MVHHLDFHARKAGVFNGLSCGQKADTIGQRGLAIGDEDHRACTIADQAARGLQGIIGRMPAGERLPFFHCIQQSD